MGSVREYAILYTRGTKSGGATVLGGGNSVLTTDVHAIDGPEHTGIDTAGIAEGHGLAYDAAAGVLVPDPGALHVRGVISPAQLVADTDNWNPTGLATAQVIRASTDASRNLTGIAAPAEARAIILANVGTEDLVLVHDATSTAANRFACPAGDDVALTPGTSVPIVYDVASSRWRVVGGTGGAAGNRIWVYIIDGGAATLTTGIRPVLPVPVDCTVVAARAYADQNGSVQVDILRTTHADYDTPSTHPVAGDSIIGAGTDITIASADKYEDTSLDWDDVTLQAGDLLAPNIISATTIRKVTIVLELQP